MPKTINYNCIGCGKVLSTSFYYPYGWICTNCRKTVKLKIPCSVCGKDVEVKWDTFKMKEPDIPWRCRRCNDDYRNQVYENRSDEYKKAFKERQAANTKKYWDNLSKEDKEKDSNRRKDLWKDRKENGDADRLLSIMKKGRKDWWNSLMEDDKEAQLKRLNDIRNAWWESLSQEEKGKHMKIAHEVMQDKWDSMSQEERLIQMKNMHDGNQKFWEEMTPEKFRKWRVENNIKMKELKDKTPGECIDRDPTNTENSFMNIIRINQLDFKFQYPSVMVHPDFLDKFKVNPITGSELVDPTHVWDFAIQIGEEKILIDIDGSVHNDNNEYTIWNDGKRPYQTDEYQAFVISCPDDKLTSNSQVTNIKNNNKMSFDAFIAYLKFTRNPNKYKKCNLKPND